MPVEDPLANSFFFEFRCPICGNNCKSSMPPPKHGMKFVCSNCETLQENPIDKMVWH